MSQLRLVLVTSTNKWRFRRYLEEARELQAKIEGWNIGTADMEAYIDSGQVKFYLLFLMDSRVWRPLQRTFIGCISVFTAAQFSVLGSFIIKPDFRHQGHGTDALVTIMNNPTYPQLKYLLSTPLAKPLYEKQRFQQVSNIIHYNKSITKPAYLSNLQLPRLTKEHIKALMQFDANLFALDRSTLLRSLIQRPTTATHLVYKLNDSSQLAGYGLVRKLVQGYRISIFATDLDAVKTILEGLFKHLLNTCEEEPLKVIIDCAEDKASFAAEAGFHAVATYPLMSTGPSVPSPLCITGPNAWAILTEECG